MKAHGVIALVVAAMLGGSAVFALESVTPPSPPEPEHAPKAPQQNPEVHVPDVVADKIVDAIMDWGNQHIGGPFRKGGGDEDATRSVLKDVITKASPGSVIWDLTVGNEAHTGSPEQDAPGYTPPGQTRVMPPGAVIQQPDAHTKMIVLPPNWNDPGEWPPEEAQPMPPGQAPSVPNNTQALPLPHEHDSSARPDTVTHAESAKPGSDAGQAYGGGMRIGIGAGASKEGTSTSPPADHVGQILLQAGGPGMEQAKPAPDVHLNAETPHSAPAPAQAAPTAPPAPPAHDSSSHADHNPADHFIDHSKAPIEHVGPDPGGGRVIG